MAITVKHSKVSTIPDDADTSLVRPSDWNADHTLVGTVPVANGGTGAATLTGYVKGNGTSTMTAAATIPSTDVTGLGTMSTQNSNNINVTGGAMSGVTISDYIPTTQKAAALGVATLDSSTKVPISQIPDAVIGALNYQGTWDASTNTPTLTSSVGTKGYYYVVSVAGSTNLNGTSDWLVGDWAVYNGTIWQKVDNTDSVTSVNTLTGAVVLTTTNIAEGTNLYYTDTRSRAALSAGTGISYNNTTGVITNSSPSLGGDVVGPASATDNAIARFDTTTGKLIQNSVTTIDDTGNASGILSQQFSNGSAVTLAAGKMWYDGTTGAWNAGMGNGNITQQIGEELFVYGKASTAITDSPLQCVYQTGTVGASGVITFAPTIAGITDGETIIGIATENLALNGFGRVTAFGTVRGITTNGTAYGETWADGDKIWYNPVTGGLTKVKPVAPNIKVQVGIVINAGSGGSGSFSVELAHGSELGGTDSNVQLTSPANGNILSYDGGNSYWKNTDLTAGTGISVTKSTNGVLTVTNTSPSSGGTVTSVTGTSPVVSSGGNTPAISMPAATTSVDGYLTSTDWNTFNSKGSGTVTSVSATAPLTSSGGATPNLAMPAATTSVSGYLTSTDWTTFNNKQATLVSGTNIKTINTNSILGSGDLTISASPAGSTTQVQYNNAGAFAGSSGFVYNTSTQRLDLSGTTGGFVPPKGTTAQRNGSPSDGELRFNSTLKSLEVWSGIAWIALTTQTYTASYLIVAGGGGGGTPAGAANAGGAGGGAGGLLTGTTTITTGTVYTTTVGGGGSGGGTGLSGSVGSNSSITGLTAAVGGGGGANTGNGVAGGSGGGGSFSGGTGGAGTSGQGFAGGSAAASTGVPYPNAGGGGSSAVGGATTTTVAGNGGAGTASSITGSSVTYAGGGGGSVYALLGGSAGSGGAGGGGNGGANSNPTAGTINTGGGGGGGSSGSALYPGAAGGSGVVIISVPTANYSATTTGSPTVTTSGSNTIIKFTSSGTYTG